MILRPVRNTDCAGVQSLIERCYAEYGERLCLEGADRDLLDLEAHYADGAFMVLDNGEAILGAVALVPKTNDCAALKRLYLDASVRGTGAGQRLLDWLLEEARRRNIQRIELWSDTRFTRAHAFYRKHGFHHDGQIRTMYDAHEPYEEYFFTTILPRVGERTREPRIPPTAPDA